MVLLVNMLTSEEEKAELLKTFQALDLNGDGQLSREELVKGFTEVLKVENPELEVDTIMAQIDKNNNGTLDYSEFVMATINKESLFHKKKLETLFKLFDKDNSGTISFEEIKEMLGGKNSQFSDNVWKQMLQEVDENGDGEVISKSDNSDFLGRVQNNDDEYP